MKITCEIIRDLLPLYIEDIASDDSCHLVEEHIKSCDTCKIELDRMCMVENAPIEINMNPLKKIRHSLRKKKYLTVLCSIFLSLLFAVIGFAYLTSPEYVEYKKDLITISQKDSTLSARFNTPVTNFSIDKYPTDDKTGYTYHISMWNTLWDTFTSKEDIQEVVLNPNGESITSIYYSLNNGSEDVLIYGINETPNGGVIMLPRLFLNYYACIAVILALVCGVLMLIFRKRVQVVERVIKILFLPVSYLLSQFLITGVNATSYSATRDFYAILLWTMLLYFLIFIIYTHLFKKAWRMRR